MKACDRVKTAMIKAQQGWERRRCTTPTFQTGDQVWLDGRNIRMFHPAAKLVPKRHSPFPIIRVLSPITYELHLLVQWKLHPVFHVDLLTPYYETEFHGANYDKPPPDLSTGKKNTKWSELWPRGVSHEGTSCSISSNGRAIPMRKTNGWPKRMYLQKKPSRSFTI
jgi:hypothetical protein